uniref:Peptidase C14 caspase domain-containing protein n=1 Tax=Oryza barthii TaxID=65489 RepID=A0A0D3FJB2_9ORYZ
MAVVSGRKRALLVGVSYKGDTSRELTGAAEDVKDMNSLLKKFLFPEGSIHMLTEELGAKDPLKAPTRENIMKEMRWLVEGCRAGDSLVFHFSGHGRQRKDDNGDEVDGRDEELCPVDYKESGNILDDDINDAIVKPLTQGWVGQTRWRLSPKKERAMVPVGGHAISISGCKDYQNSLEPDNTAGGGVMTRSFLEAVGSRRTMTYGELLDSMRAKVHHRLQQSSSGKCLVTGCLGSLAAKCLPCCFLSVQEPQLCSSEEFNVYEEQFIL